MARVHSSGLGLPKLIFQKSNQQESARSSAISQPSNLTPNLTRKTADIFRSALFRRVCSRLVAEIRYSYAAAQQTMKLGLNNSLNLLPPALMSNTL